MAVFFYLHIYFTSRITELRRAAATDRGDGPVPTAIIVAGLAVLAVGVVAWALNLVNDFIDTDIRTPSEPNVPER